MRCPKCGLTQSPRSTCKSCGTPLAPNGAPSSRPGPSSANTTPTGPDQANPQRKRLVWGICLILLIIIPGAFYIRSALHARAERQAASEAIQALKSLESITTAGVNYQNYAPRVLDVKVKVDQYLVSRPKKSQLAQVQLDTENTMTLYVYASQIWNATIVKNYTQAIEITKQAEVLCPELVSELDQQAARMEKRLTEDARFGRPPRPMEDDPKIIKDIVERLGPGKTWISPSFLWGCARRHISNAEKHIGG